MRGELSYLLCVVGIVVVSAWLGASGAPTASPRVEKSSAAAPSEKHRWTDSDRARSVDLVIERDTCNMVISVCPAPRGAYYVVSRVWVDPDGASSGDLPGYDFKKLERSVDSVIDHLGTPSNHRRMMIKADYAIDHASRKDDRRALATAEQLSTPEYRDFARTISAFLKLLPNDALTGVRRNGHYCRNEDLEERLKALDSFTF